MPPAHALAKKVGAWALLTGSNQDPRTGLCGLARRSSSATITAHDPLRHGVRPTGPTTSIKAVPQLLGSAKAGNSRSPARPPRPSRFRRRAPCRRPWATMAAGRTAARWRAAWPARRRHTYRSRAPATWPAAPPLATTGSTSCSAPSSGSPPERRRCRRPRLASDPWQPCCPSCS